MQEQEAPKMQEQEEVKQAEIAKAKVYLAGVSMRVLAGQMNGKGRHNWYKKLVKAELESRKAKK